MLLYVNPSPSRKEFIIFFLIISFLHDYIILHYVLSPIIACLSTKIVLSWLHVFFFHSILSLDLCLVRVPFFTCFMYPSFDFSPTMLFSPNSFLFFSLIIAKFFPSLKYISSSWYMELRWRYTLLVEDSTPNFLV